PLGASAATGEPEAKEARLMVPAGTEPVVASGGACLLLRGSPRGGFMYPGATRASRTGRFRRARALLCVIPPTAAARAAGAGSAAGEGSEVLPMARRVELGLPGLQVLAMVFLTALAGVSPVFPCKGKELRLSRIQSLPPTKIYPTCLPLTYMESSPAKATTS